MPLTLAQLEERYPSTKQAADLLRLVGYDTYLNMPEGRQKHIREAVKKVVRGFEGFPLTNAGWVKARRVTRDIFNGVAEENGAAGFEVVDYPVRSGDRRTQAVEIGKRIWQIVPEEMLMKIEDERDRTMAETALVTLLKGMADYDCYKGARKVMQDALYDSKGEGRLTRGWG